MKKRLTDCDCWKDPWFRKLIPEYKLFWKYILESCECWGEWKPDEEMTSFLMGIKINLEQVLEVFNTKDKKRITVFPNGNWFINEFNFFQYGELSERCNAHKPVFENLKRLENKGYLKGTHRDHNKDQDQDKDQNKNNTFISVVGYLNEKAGTKFSHKNQSTVELIKARLKEGRTQEDFMVVINKKFRDWGNDAKMSKYIRPSTLFNRTNFENYLNEPENGKRAVQISHAKSPQKECINCRGTGFVYAPGSGKSNPCPCTKGKI